jgi:hypothetical protein
MLAHALPSLACMAGKGGRNEAYTSEGGICHHALERQGRAGSTRKEKHPLPRIPGTGSNDLPLDSQATHLQQATGPIVGTTLLP